MLLARTLGRTVQELLETMSPAELDLWAAEYCRSPWGDVRGDMNAGMVTAAIYNMSGKALKQGAPTLTFRDFMGYGQPVSGKPASESPLDHFKALKP